MIFVNSMSDLFHKDIPRDHISKVFDTMEKADWHTYQVLTKRSSLLRKFSSMIVIRAAKLPRIFGSAFRLKMTKSFLVLPPPSNTQTSASASCQISLSSAQWVN